MIKRITSVICCVILCTVCASAHPGQTDENGGHYEQETGEYHYHHGYPAHQHENGICPYNYDDQTGINSGGSSANAQDTVTEPSVSEDQSIATQDEYKYNNGFGDDGTYETAYNLGYQHAIEEFWETNSDFSVDFSELTSKLCHDNALSGSTPYRVRDSSFNEAYENGWNQAADDIYSSINEALSQYVNGVSEQELLNKYQEGHRVGIEETQQKYTDVIATQKALKIALGIAGAVIVLLLLGWTSAIKNVRKNVNVFFRDLRTLARLSQDGNIKIDEINKILRSINEEQMK